MSDENNKNEIEDPNALIAQFQMVQQQLQNLMIQKETLNMNKMEIERALEELSKTKDEKAYKITGGIMISKPVSELKEELENTKEAIEIRLKSFENPEKHLTNQMKKIQDKVKTLM